ncbi:MAG: RNA methyltransferase [Myxococcota bacterium]|nr:RNA methyltransferase [Myxococcota bacterium]
MRKILSQRLSHITVIAEAIHLRHNLSAILRSAESFGVQDVHLIRPKHMKGSSAARGAERWLDIHAYDSLNDCVDRLKSQGFQIWVADLDENAQIPEKIPLDKPVAVLMGTELTGVSEEARSCATGFIKVPMYGQTQSLNVSVATACILYALTQRCRQKLPVPYLSKNRQEEIVNRWLRRDEKNKKSLRKRVEVMQEKLLEPTDGEDRLD